MEYDNNNHQDLKQVILFIYLFIFWKDNYFKSICKLASYSLKSYMKLLTFWFLQKKTFCLVHKENTRESKSETTYEILKHVSKTQ